MRSSSPLAIGLLLTLPIAACGGEVEPTLTEPARRIVTTFYPTTYFAQRIVGDAVEVKCPLPADKDPIHWKPSREALAVYQNSALVVINGAQLEKWVAKASLPESRVVNTAIGFKKEWIEHEGDSHSHGGQGQHSHKGFDGHTWLDPVLAKRQAEAIKDAAIRHFPEGKAKFEAGFKALAKDLDDLGSRLQALSPSLAKVQILCSHEAYNYPATRYNWTIVNLDLDPETPLTDADLVVLGQHPHSGSRVMLWESEPHSKSRAKLDKLGIKSVLYSPAEQKGEDDWLQVMRANIDRLAAAVADGK